MTMKLVISDYCFQRAIQIEVHKGGKSGFRKSGSMFYYVWIELVKNGKCRSEYDGFDIIS